MCEVKKTIDAKVVKEHLQKMVKLFNNADEPVQATLVMDEQYHSVTAICGNQVLCINLMN